MVLPLWSSWACTCLPTLSRASPRGSLSWTLRIALGIAWIFVFDAVRILHTTTSRFHCRDPQVHLEPSSWLRLSGASPTRSTAVRWPACHLALRGKSNGSVALWACSIKTTMRVLTVLAYSLNVNVHSAHFVFCLRQTLLAARASENCCGVGVAVLAASTAASLCVNTMFFAASSINWDPATLPCLLMTNTTHRERERQGTFPLAVVCDQAPVPSKFRDALNTIPCDVQLQCERTSVKWLFWVSLEQSATVNVSRRVNMMCTQLWRTFTEYKELSTSKTFTAQFITSLPTSRINIYHNEPLSWEKNFRPAKPELRSDASRVSPSVSAPPPPTHSPRAANRSVAVRVRPPPSPPGRSLGTRATGLTLVSFYFYIMLFHWVLFCFSWTLISFTSLPSFIPAGLSGHFCEQCDQFGEVFHNRGSTLRKGVGTSEDFFNIWHLKFKLVTSNGIQNTD